MFWFEMMNEGPALVAWPVVKLNQSRQAPFYDDYAVHTRWLWGKEHGHFGREPAPARYQDLFAVDEPPQSFAGPFTDVRDRLKSDLSLLRGAEDGACEGVLRVLFKTCGEAEHFVRVRLREAENACYIRFPIG